jgi:osmotically-inducible protein OsmY
MACPIGVRSAFRLHAFAAEPARPHDVRVQSVRRKEKNLGTAAVSTTDDAAITLSVSSALANDPELSAIRIDVETKGGTVRLAGPAPNAAAKARAGEIAKAVNGVATVDNQLVVSPG